MNVGSLHTSIQAKQPNWVVVFARLGLIAKGIVYCITGLLAFMAAFELGGSNQNSADKAGVFRTIMDQPFGKILLSLLAIGLICYSLWRFTQAIKDTEHKGNNFKGLIRRVAYAFSGLFYGSLAIGALSMVLGGGSGNNGNEQNIAKEILTKPFGQWLAGVVALIIIGLGVYQIYRAYSNKYAKKIRTRIGNPNIQNLMLRTGKIGYTARGIVYGIIGYLFLKAAIHSNSSEAGGTNNAFAFLEQGSYGSLLLGIVAFGLICFGIFMFVRSRYETIQTA